MVIYLMQHGEALSAEEDPERPLSMEGRRNVTAVADRAATCGVRIEHVVHSGKLRAEQTATILADGIGCPDVHRRAGLAPNDPVEPIAAWLAEEAPSSVAVVGHLPHLDRLASLLVAGDTAAQVVALRNGGLVRLAPKTHGRGWAVAWILTPELAVG